jgi:hypothetical protein
MYVCIQDLMGVHFMQGKEERGDERRRSNIYISCIHVELYGFLLSNSRMCLTGIETPSETDHVY